MRSNWLLDISGARQTVRDPEETCWQRRGAFYGVTGGSAQRRDGSAEALNVVLVAVGFSEKKVGPYHFLVHSLEIITLLIFMF